MLALNRDAKLKLAKERLLAYRKRREILQGMPESGLETGNDINQTIQKQSSDNLQPVSYSDSILKVDKSIQEVGIQTDLNLQSFQLQVDDLKVRQKLLDEYESAISKKEEECLKREDNIMKIESLLKQQRAMLEKSKKEWLFHQQKSDSIEKHGYNRRWGCEEQKLKDNFPSLGFNTSQDSVSVRNEKHLYSKSSYSISNLRLDDLALGEQRSTHDNQSRVSYGSKNNQDSFQGSNKSQFRFPIQSSILEVPLSNTYSHQFDETYSASYREPSTLESYYKERARDLDEIDRAPQYTYQEVGRNSTSRHSRRYTMQESYNSHLDLCTDKSKSNYSNVNINTDFRVNESERTNHWNARYANQYGGDPMSYSNRNYPDECYKSQQSNTRHSPHVDNVSQWVEKTSLYNKISTFSRGAFRRYVCNSHKY
ncbi:hypothetical protein HDV02_001506 [Globomyces sp. JEL0801]|nr:hypothetical protein HDV02_001506 [Globomyces sp. JEL0801]